MSGISGLRTDILESFLALLLSITPELPALLVLTVLEKTNLVGIPDISAASSEGIPLSNGLPNTCCPIAGLIAPCLKFNAIPQSVIRRVQSVHVVYRIELSVRRDHNYLRVESAEDHMLEARRQDDFGIASSTFARTTVFAHCIAAIRSLPFCSCR